MSQIITKLTIAITFTLASLFLASTIFVNASPIYVPPFYADAPETPTCSTTLDHLENCVTQKLYAEIDKTFPTDNSPSNVNVRTAILFQIIADATNDPAQKTNVEQILANANANPTCTKNAVLHYVKYSKISYKNDLYNAMTDTNPKSMKHTDLLRLQNNLTVCTYSL
jgi:hypothetical protein